MAAGWRERRNDSFFRAVTDGTAVYEIINTYAGEECLTVEISQPDTQIRYHTRKKQKVFVPSSYNDIYSFLQCECYRRGCGCGK